MMGSADKAVLRCIPDVWVLPRHGTEEKGDLKQQAAPPPPVRCARRSSQPQGKLCPSQVFLRLRPKAPFEHTATPSPSDQVGACTGDKSSANPNRAAPGEAAGKCPNPFSDPCLPQKGKWQTIEHLCLDRRDSLQEESGRARL